MAATVTASNQTASNVHLIGISFPFTKSNGQFPATVQDVACVDNDLIALFKLPARTRVMRPTVGTTAFQLCFESQGDLLNARLERSIRQTIGLNAPLVSVINITFTQTDTLITALVNYSVQGIASFVNLEFQQLAA